MSIWHRFVVLTGHYGSASMASRWYPSAQKLPQWGPGQHAQKRSSMEDSETTEQSPDGVFYTAVVFESALGVFAILLGWLFGPDPREMLPELSLDGLFPGAGGAAADWSSLAPIGNGLLYGCLAAVPMLLVIEIIRRLPWEPVRALERLTDDGMIRALLRLNRSEMIVISICAGVGEELLFRGWLMYWLIDGWNALGDQGVSPQFAMIAGLIGSSVAFGLVHPITKLYVAIAAVMGLYFGALVLLTGNLLIPIVAHAAYDAVQLTMTSRTAAAQAVPSETSD